MNCINKNCNILDKNHTCFRNSNGKLHREDGPALIWASGSQGWCQNGRWHREDGPAKIYADGRQFWYIKGKEIL